MEQVRARVFEEVVRQERGNADTAKARPAPIAIVEAAPGRPDSVPLSAKEPVAASGVAAHPPPLVHSPVMPDRVIQSTGSFEPRHAPINPVDRSRAGPAETNAVATVLTIGNSESFVQRLYLRGFPGYASAIDGLNLIAAQISGALAAQQREEATLSDEAARRVAFSDRADQYAGRSNAWP